MDEQKPVATENTAGTGGPMPGTKKQIGAAVLFVIAAASVPLAAFSYAPIPLAVLMAAGLFFLSRKMKDAVLLTLLAAALASPVFLWGASLGFLWLAAATSAFAGAYLLTFLPTRLRWIPVPLAAAAFGIAAAVLRAPLTAMLAFLVLPAAYILWGMTEYEETRCFTVAVTACMFLFPVVYVWLLYYFAFPGHPDLTVENMTALVAGWRERATAEAVGQARQVLDGMRATAGESTAATFEKLLGESAVADYVNTFFNLLPAVLAVACEIPAFLAQRLLISGYVTAAYPEGVATRRVVFRPRILTAVLYAAALFISLFGTALTNRFFAVVENLRLILMPAFCVAGVRAVAGLYLRSGRSARALWWIGGISLVCCSFPLALGLLSALGVYNVIDQAARDLLANLPDDRDRGE